MADAGKDIIFEERRKAASKDVIIKFIDDAKIVFNVLDAAGNLKYDGKVIGKDPHIDDYCSCKSFENGNNPKGSNSYADIHGYAFQCKHILGAREEKFHGV